MEVTVNIRHDCFWVPKCIEKWYFFKSTLTFCVQHISIPKYFLKPIPRFGKLFQEGDNWFYLPFFIYLKDLKWFGGKITYCWHEYFQICDMSEEAKKCYVSIPWYIFKNIPMSQYKIAKRRETSFLMVIWPLLFLLDIPVKI